MHPCVKKFCKMGALYESQQHKLFATDLIAKLRPVVDEEQIRQVLKNMNLSMALVKKQNTSKNNEYVSDTQKTNIMKFLIMELKANMPHTTIVQKRHVIAQKVMNEMHTNALSLEDAKNKIYPMYDINITQNIPMDVNKTNEQNMHIERDYDEYSGRIVYGWDSDGEVLYEPTFGAYIDAPTFKNSGIKWREVLNNRWEPLSFYDEDEELDDFTGY